MADFACISECSDCCVDREYFPDVRFGKIGVLLLPAERAHVEQMASELGIRIRILPRVGVSSGADDVGPDRTVAYQLMGRDADGDTCPFLDTTDSVQSPHGGRGCTIYDRRPLACRAYPLQERVRGSSKQRPSLLLDQKCRFCKEHPRGADGGLDSEEAALLQIQRDTTCNDPVVWRFATATGDPSDRDKFLDQGWIREQGT